VETLDTLLALLERYGVSIAFAIYCAMEVHYMREQLIKVEVAYSKQLEELNKQLVDLVKEYTAMVKEYTDAARGLRDQIHELKNVIQRGIFDVHRATQKGNGDD
jgi:uncharacterized phage infection (PIP) family protein YhgE